MISWLLPQASSFASTIDGLVLLIAVIVGFWLILAEVVLFGFIFKYRARDGIRGQYVSGEDRSQKTWVSYPHYAVVVFDIIIIVAALRVWNEVKVAAPPGEEQIRIIAQQWSWTFVHAGPDGKLDTPDDIRTVDDMYVQRDRVYTFELHARDVVHSFSVPAFRLKQDAIPGRAIHGWFRPTREGTFDIQCVEMCGVGHGLMAGRIHIGSAAQYAAWMTEFTNTAVAAHRIASSTPIADVAAHDHAGTAGGTR
ncbi:MAG: cytochrome C oxidase subunit II [Acidobacteria bacterium]|nr:cytochrome C oxidase subunit II [Acidobacteriota bacterium]